MHTFLKMQGGCTWFFLTGQKNMSKAIRFFPLDALGPQHFLNELHCASPTNVLCTIGSCWQLVVVVCTLGFGVVWYTLVHNQMFYI